MNINEALKVVEQNIYDIQRDGCGACSHAVYVADTDKGTRLFCKRCVENHRVLWDRAMRPAVSGASWWALIAEVLLRIVFARRRQKQ